MIWTLLACADASPPAAPPTAPSEPAAAAPASIEVRPVGVDELRTRILGPSDRVRLVNFWATWCPPCRAEMPVLAAWGRAHPEVELIFVDLDLPKLRTSKVEPFLVEQQLEGFVHLLLDDPDPIGALSRIVPGWPDQVPVTLRVAPDGTVTKRWDRAVTAADLETP